MRREEFKPRDNWEERIAAQGLVYDLDGPEDTQHYWNETAAYIFDESEVDSLESQVEDLHGMCVEAAKFLATGAMGTMGYSQKAFDFAKESLEASEPDFYGRFDLVYSGDGSPAKMLEYNADTPTGIIEAAVCQWYWKEDRFPFRKNYNKYDQWNSILDAYKNRWQELLKISDVDVLHFANVHNDSSGEDWVNTALLRDTADQAGWTTVGLTMPDIGWDPENKMWTGRFDEKIHNIFKLYPWEDMVDEDFGDILMQEYHRMDHWFEPAWKMFLSNKTLLAALWHLYPNHPNLAPAFLGEKGGLKEWVMKPIFGREGDGIEINSKNFKLKSPYDYPKTGINNEVVYQEWCEIPNYIDSKGGSNYPILGAWVVGGKSVGVGIRESDGPITDYYCRFASNLIELGK